MSRLAIVALALLGAGLILYHTRLGPGASGDSTSYLMGARNLIEGNGFSRYSGSYEVRPISGFPPFFSVLLAGGLGLGLDGYLTSRILNAAFFGATILLTAFIGTRCARNWRAGLVTAVLLISAEPLVHWHSWVMSEGTYLFLVIGAIWLFLRALERESPGLLAATGLVLAMATLTRYIGIALIGAGGLTLLLLRSTDRFPTLRDLGLYLAASLLPVLGWLRRNQLLQGSSVNRELNFHGIDPDLARWYLAEMSSWFIPHAVPLPTAVRAALALLLAGLLLWVLLRSILASAHLRERIAQLRLGLGDDYGLFLSIVGVGLLGHLAILAANSLFLDASTSPSAVPRYLTPVYLLLILLASVVVVRWLGTGHRGAGTWLALAYLVALAAIRAGNVVALLADPIANMGYMGYRLRWTQEVGALTGLGDRTIVTNNPELVYVLADRPAYARPIAFDHYQQEERQDYQHQLEATQQRMEQGAVLVVFRPVEQADLATVEYAQANELASFAHAVFYGYPSRVPPIQEAGGS